VFDVSADGQPFRLTQQIALEVGNRDEYLRALAHLHSRGVEPINGPLVHSMEGGGGIRGSGSRSFHFLDPDGNRLEIFTDAMKVSNGEQFPKEEYMVAMKAYTHG